MKVGFLLIADVLRVNLATGKRDNFIINEVT